MRRAGTTIAHAIPPRRAAADPALPVALTTAAAAVARLDEALAGHPLRPAFLHRVRLDAVRRQAAADGALIDPWHLAAVLEGLRLRLDGAARLVDRAAVLEAARHACTLHQWLTGPDSAAEQEVRRAAAALAEADRAAPGLPLLGAAQGARAWLGAGGARAPLRAALVRHWMHHGLITLPVPLTGAAAFHPGAAWPCAFLHALAGEAADWRRALADLERAWLAARRAVAGQRRGSQAAAVVDLLAAAPLLSATSLAGLLGIAVRTAIRHLDELAAAGIAVEVTHRASRRLFGLAGQAPLREAVRPPDRPVPGRGRGRPPLRAPAADVPPPPPPLPPLSPLERRAFDYGDLAAGLAQLDQAVRRTRLALDALAPLFVPPRPLP